MTVYTPKVIVFTLTRRYLTGEFKEVEWGNVYTPGQQCRVAAYVVHDDILVHSNSFSYFDQFSRTNLQQLHQNNNDYSNLSC